MWDWHEADSEEKMHAYQIIVIANEKYQGRFEKCLVVSELLRLNAKSSVRRSYNFL